MSQPWSLVSQSSAPSGVTDGRSIKVRRGSRRGTQTTAGEEAAGGERWIKNKKKATFYFPFIIKKKHSCNPSIYKKWF